MACINNNQQGVSGDHSYSAVVFPALCLYANTSQSMRTVPNSNKSGSSSGDENLAAAAGAMSHVVGVAVSGVVQSSAVAWRMLLAAAAVPADVVFEHPASATVATCSGSCCQRPQRYVRKTNVYDVERPWQASRRNALDHT